MTKRTKLPKPIQVADMDGDGWVAEVVVATDLGGPRLHWTINYGAYRTTLEVRPDEIDGVIDLLKLGRKALRAALA